MGEFGSKLSRIISLCVVVGMMSSVAYGENNCSISSKETAAKNIDISDDASLTFADAGCLNIGSNTSRSLKAISFGTSETDTGAGKAFTINNNSSADQLIDVKNTYLNSSGYCKASAIDLTGVSGEASNLFKIALPTTDETYSFSSTANSDSAGTYAAVIGLPSASDNSVEYIAVDTKNTAKLNFNATATGGTTYSGAAVFGTGHANNSGTLTNWTIEDIGTGSKLTANATGLKDAYSAIFGAGRANGSVDFRDWKIGTIEGGTGNDRATTLTSTAEKGYSSVFGVGYAYLNSNSKTINFSGWKIGSLESGSEKNSIGNNVTITSEGKYATVFGVGCAEFKNGENITFSNWTIGNIGENANLTSTSSSSAADISDYSVSSIFGAGHAIWSANFSEWKIGNFGENVVLESISGSWTKDKTKEFAYSRSSIFGAGKAELKNGEEMTFSSWKVGDIGAGVQLMSTATAIAYNQAYSQSSIFGAGYASGAEFQNWKIGSIFENAELTSVATSSFFLDSYTSKTSKMAYSSIFGAGYTTGKTYFDSWEIKIIDGGVKLISVSYADPGNFNCEGCEYADFAYSYSNIFGVGHVWNGSSFKNWSIGNIGPESVLTSISASRASTAQSAAYGDGDNSIPSPYSSIFGAGRVYNGKDCSDSTSFCNWTVGNIGENATLTSTANVMPAPKKKNQEELKSSPYASIFGAGEVKINNKEETSIDFSNWTIGNVGDNVTFTSNANNGAIYDEVTNATFSYSSVVGVGCASGSDVEVKNWTMEYNGNSVIASTASGNGAYISTLGGYVNGGSLESDGMRFYFNGEQASDEPVITIGALKLSEPWKVDGNKTAAATIGGDQEGVRAFGIGQNFQINVGRKRTLKVDGSGETDGTGGTFDSIKNGGSSSSGIKLNILGEIRAAEGNGGGVQGGSIMRIDGGSTVNCFRPVSNLSKIEIINGSMHLMDSSNETELDDALQHLQANISYSRAVTEDVTEDGPTIKKTKTELYQNNGAKTAIGSAGAKRAGRDGNVKLANGGYPIDGKLTIGSGQTLVFGVDLSKNEEGDLSAFKKTNGVLYLPNTGNCLVLDCGMLAIEDCNSEKLDELGEIPSNANFYVVRTKYEDGIGPKNQEFFSGCDVAEDPVDANNNVKLYKITKNGSSIVSTGNAEYTYWEGLHAYLMNDKHLGGGIVIGTGDAIIDPAVKLTTDYTKDFASEELSAIDAEIMSDIQKQVIFAEMCSYKQDPFIMVLGGHGHQDEILGYGYDYDKYGIVIGHDFVKELSNGGNLKFGGSIGYCHANIDFFGNATSRSKHAGKDMYNVGIFCMYKNDNSKHMHTRFHVFGGFAYVENEMSRVDGTNARFNTKFDSNDINVSAEFTKGMIKLCGLEVGPWAGVTYNRIHQKSYHENGGRNAASLDAVNFDMLDTILGLHAEKIFLHKKNDKRYLHLVLRAGWKCQAIRSHSHCLAQLDDAGIDPFVPVFGYADKHSGIVYGGLKNKISDNLSISGGIGSVIGHDHWNIGGHIALNYYY